MFFTVLKYLSGPLMGAVIGYFTNYIAVRMLFRPKKEIRICGRRVPFTPGAIPKEQPRIARAVGNTVAKNLITGEDLKKKILSDESEQLIIKTADDFLDKDLKTELNMLPGMDEAAYAETRDMICDTVTKEIKEALCSLCVSRIIKEKGTKLIMDMVDGTMLSMFLQPSMIEPVLDQIGVQAEIFLEQESWGYIRPAVEGKVDELEKRSGHELMTELGSSREAIHQMIHDVFHQVLGQKVDEIMETLDIAGIIEDKINAMDMDELETLVLDVMKKELDMIVNLGALVGFVLGLVNLVTIIL